ncbi:hypothetical protein PCASD_12011 [Puccinia coronata f. sp. avenae]|uniref:RhoGAP-domain-containing protein n=1 Tax=Puccinia coronata f. sp. avenae TaxID=200324 RepID=A0A2N5TBQ1_9BASI|nr:hypothetical protein PCASD_12011 [Puccinia coronata f. sp. avenae]
MEASNLEDVGDDPHQRLPAARQDELTNGDDSENGEADRSQGDVTPIDGGEPAGRIVTEERAENQDASGELDDRNSQPSDYSDAADHLGYSELISSLLLSPSHDDGHQDHDHDNHLEKTSATTTTTVQNESDPTTMMTATTIAAGTTTTRVNAGNGTGYPDQPVFQSGREYSMESIDGYYQQQQQPHPMTLRRPHTKPLQGSSPIGDIQSSASILLSSRACEDDDPHLRPSQSSGCIPTLKSLMADDRVPSPEQMSVHRDELTPRSSSLLGSPGVSLLQQRRRSLLVSHLLRTRTSPDSSGSTTTTATASRPTLDSDTTTEQEQQQNNNNNNSNLSTTTTTTTITTIASSNSSKKTNNTNINTLNENTTIQPVQPKQQQQQQQQQHSKHTRIIRTRFTPKEKEEQEQHTILTSSPKSLYSHQQASVQQPLSPTHSHPNIRSFNLPHHHHHHPHPHPHPHPHQHLTHHQQPIKSLSDPASCLDGQQHSHHQSHFSPSHPFIISQQADPHSRSSPSKLTSNAHQSSMESSHSNDSHHPTTHPLIESSSSSSNSSIPSSSPHQLTSHQTPSSSQSPITPSTSSSPRQPCAKCRQSMTGQFVRALGTVYHLNCFRCQDCGKVVASKFFPVDTGSPDGKAQYPLCETDYFRRLGLICAKCGGALRGSYITALDMKFHVEHFTCSVCPTVFGPQDSYYEHSGQVYCHFHYSTRFAVKCTGCRTAILKQFVEINRNNTDEHWHPECYMINKFWNIKLAVSSFNPQSVQSLENDPSHSHDTNSDSNSIDPSSSTAVSSQTVKSSQASLQTTPDSPDNWRNQEVYETAQTLKDKQKQMEEQVYRIWTVLSTFEESSAACISEMLRHVSSGLYLEGVRMAGKFVLHVETLFAAIDDLDVIFQSKNAQEISHVREARMLCKKIVNFFSLLSHTHETGARKMSITKELLSLVTGLAHYLKILIRIALTSALKLEREYSDRNGILQFLSRLDRLARDPDASKATSGPPPAQPPDRAGPSSSQKANPSMNGKLRPYGYKSLTRAVGTLVGKGDATTDLCEGCKQTIEEECVRFGTSARWHTACLKCSTCHRAPSKSDKADTQSTSNDNPNSQQPPAPQLKRYKLDVQAPREGATRLKILHVYCEECAQITLRTQNPPINNLVEGLELVTRLEQYAFLLCVALNKLYGLLKQRGILPASADDPRYSHMNGESLYDAYRNSTDIKRMKSVDLDRKLSTTARIPQRSTVVESPSGRVAQAASESQQQNGAGQGMTPLRPLDATVRQTTNRSFAAPVRPPQDRLRPMMTHPSRERDFATPTRSEPPPRPPPTHLNLLPQGNGHNTSYPSSSTLVTSPPIYGDLSKQQQHYATDVRPPLARNLTAVKIVDDQPGPNELVVRDEPRLGSSTSPVSQDTAGITLADLPRAMEAEQFREQQKPLPTQVATLSELSALESVIVKHVAALTLASDSSAIRDDTSLDELLEIIEARKGNFWGKLFKGGNDKAKIKKKGVFGVPLDVLIERHGVDSLLGAGAGQLRVPSFVDDCISAMKQMDMSVEGVFRKNGNIRRLKELTDAIDRDDSNVNFSDDNAVQLAALLKKFLRDLPDPLLTFKLYHLFIASQRVENDAARRKTLHLICCLLPKAHRDTMEVLFVFLKWVASFSHVDEETGSKMDLQNLATVITPNILYARSKDPTRDESFLAIRAVHELLEYQDELFQMPPEVSLIMQDQELLSSNMNEITSKDILKRVEALLKANHGKLRPPAKLGAEHYRGKGEVQPHRPDLHASSAHPNDGSRAEHQHHHHHHQQQTNQGRTGGPQFANGYPAEPNGYPTTPGVGQQPPTNRAPDHAAHLHHQLRETSLHSPSQQRHSFHRDQLPPSSSSTAGSHPHPPSNSSSKVPSPSSGPLHPHPYPPHPAPPPQPPLPPPQPSAAAAFSHNENSHSGPIQTPASSAAGISQRIPLDQRSAG